MADEEKTVTQKDVRLLTEKVAEFCKQFPELCEGLGELKAEVQALKEIKPLTEEHIPAIVHENREHLKVCPACRASYGLLTEEEAEAKFKPKEVPKPELILEPTKPPSVPKAKPKVKSLKREELPASFSAYSAYGLKPEEQADGRFIIRDKGKFAEIWGPKGERASLKFIPVGCSLKCEDPDKPESWKVVCED